MKIVGYTDRLSVAPGETVRFMVSCEASRYRADIVRLVHGDTNPEGPGFKEELVETSANGEYPGRRQAIYSGSYAVVPDSPQLRLTGSFTLQAWLYPTTPRKGAQGIVTKWSADDAGYGLFVDEDGDLALWLSNGRGQVERARTGVAMRAAQWYFVAGVFDARNRRVTLYQEPVSIWPRDDSRATVERSSSLSSLGVSDAHLLMAGRWGSEHTGKSIVQGLFNGKIDSPRLFGRALSREEIESLRREAPPSQFGNAVVAAWDFGGDFASDKVTDTSPNNLHGRTVNTPARAMTGHNWKGNETDFKLAPKEYGAIYFHDDDLDDARWDVDFELTVPESMRSGVYAARLVSGQEEGAEDYVPFFVRPRRGTSSAPILFLVPTASYLAYANSHSLSNPANRARWERLLGKKIEFDYPSTPQDKYIVENRLHSLYDRHTDGSGVAYSSRLRPILNMRPKYYSPLLGEGKGAPHQLNADLHLLDWMDVKGYQYDVVTDEDLNFEGAGLLAPYLVVVTGSHPEYWSTQMLDALEEYMSNGGRLMYLGGNGFYWVTTFDPQRPHVVEVRRWRGTESWEADPGEFYHSTTGELGGLWRFRGRAPQRLTGVGFSAQGFDYSLPYHYQPGSEDPRASFIFEGVNKDEPIGDFGLVMGGAGGFEVDRADIALGTPPHALVLATSTGFSDVYQHVVEEVLISDSKQGGTVNPLVKGDLVYFEGPRGGAVFSVGSISWCGSLSHNNYDNNVSRITGNVLTRFASEEPIA
jgi:N,N-dimethylformamidase